MTTKKQKPPGSLLEINVLPQRYRKKKIQVRTILPWVLLVLMTILIYPVGKIMLETQAVYRSRVQEFQAAQLAVENFDNREEQLAALESDLQAAENQVSSYQESIGVLQLDFTRWSAVFSKLVSSKPSGIDLESLFLLDGSILITGRSDTYQQPLQMVENIAVLGEFDEVQMSTIELIEIEETDDETSPDTDSGGWTGYQFEILVIPSENGGLQ